QVREGAALHARGASLVARRAACPGAGGSSSRVQGESPVPQPGRRPAQAGCRRVSEGAAPAHSAVLESTHPAGTVTEDCSSHLQPTARADLSRRTKTMSNRSKPSGNEEGKRVGIWVRVSTEDQAKGESPEHHEARGRMYAEAKGWTPVTVYDLAGVSGKSVM